MGLDLRIPIGGMFTLVGLLITIYGLLTASSPTAYEKSLNININLIWGAVMLVFGVIFLVFGLRKGRSAANGAPSGEAEPVVESAQPGMH